MNKNIFRAYDIRGIADPSCNSTSRDSAESPPDLTEKTVYLIGKATGTYLKEKYGTANMSVGRDNRLTGEKLKNAYIKGLLETGINVTDLGLSTSPMIYWSVCAANFDAGTNITASHNPKEYNGIKIVTKNAHSICGDEIQEIYKIIRTNSFKTSEKKGKLKTENIWPAYLKDLTSRLLSDPKGTLTSSTKLCSAKRVPFHIKRKIKVVVDAGNGIVGKFAPEFLQTLGCEVIPLYCDLDGTFPNHEANPESEKNLTDLIKKVQTEKANIGFGFDGDGDRIGVIDENGKFYQSDFILFLLAKDLAKRLPNSKIVFDVKTSQAIINKIADLNLVPIMSKTGHSFIEAKMKEIGSPLAGETSGHLFFRENYYGFDDAIFAAGKIIEILSNSEIPLSQMFNDIPKTYTTEELKVPCPDDKKFEIVKKLTDHFTKLYPCITIDGVRVNFDKTSWGAIRASNTSPMLTLRFEADTKLRLNEIQKIMSEELEKNMEVETN